MVQFRSGTLLGESKGGHPGPDDLFGDECKKNGQAAIDEGTEGRSLRNGVKKEQKGEEDK